MKPLRWSRREALRAGLLAAPALALPGWVRAGEGECMHTPRQKEGPFYPVEPLPADADLTVVPGHSQAARGERIVVTGRVTDGACRPLAGARLEIWQACYSGSYDHPRDGNPAPRDPHFQYSGRAEADAEGRYTFRTIVPGAYPVGPNWMRPSHIHFKVRREGYPELITQMYFEGDKHIPDDRILQSVSPARQGALVVSPQPPPAGAPDRGRLCRFDLVLA